MNLEFLTKYNSFKNLINALNKIFYLFQTYAPKEVFLACFKNFKKNKVIKDKYRDKYYKYNELKNSLRLSNDWFSGNVPFWHSIIADFSLHKKHIKILEIGSWEGLSCNFMLTNMENSEITCVDTWQGADEHKDITYSPHINLNQIETIFDQNISKFKERVTKYRGSSYSFFNNHYNPSFYDLIYIDGSHHSDDVMIDAIKCFGMLKIGGLMIFDDYFWQYYSDIKHNPAMAINLFLKLKKNSFKIIRIYYQIIILKISDN